MLNKFRSEAGLPGQGWHCSVSKEVYLEENLPTDFQKWEADLAEYPGIYGLHSTHVPLDVSLFVDLGLSVLRYYLC